MPYLEIVHRPLNIGLMRSLTKLHNSNSLIENINYSQEFLKSYSGLSGTQDFDLKYKLIRLFVEKIIINYCDVDEKYTVDVTVKLPHFKELHTFKLNKKGHPTILFDEQQIDPFNFSNINYLCKVSPIESDISTRIKEGEAVLPNYFNALHSHPQKQQLDIADSMVANGMGGWLPMHP